MHCNRLLAAAVFSLALEACGAGTDTSATAPLQADDAPEFQVDRFSDAAGTLMVRSASNALPEPGAPIDFDRPPFITRGLGPDGQIASYYNFDVQSTIPAPIYVLFRDGQDTPLESQLNIVDTVPGDAGYNDFWQVHRVTVPETYVANTVTSLGQLEAAGYPVRATDDIVNCPVVPRGSTAALRTGGGSPGLTQGWYRDQTVYYFNFAERPLTGSQVPVAGIYVAFNTNPDQAGGGPPSGFKVEVGTDQTHNVLDSVPTDAGYSPLWSVSPYDNADFEEVRDLASVTTAAILARDVATVNCPVVETGN